MQRFSYKYSILAYLVVTKSTREYLFRYVTIQRQSLYSLKISRTIRCLSNGHLALRYFWSSITNFSRRSCTASRVVSGPLQSASYKVTLTLVSGVIFKLINVFIWDFKIDWIYTFTFMEDDETSVQYSDYITVIQNSK